MRLPMLMSILAVLPAGCFQELFDAGAALAPNTESSSGSGSTSTSATEVTPTTAVDPGIQTVTGLPDETTALPEPDATSEAPGQNEPPTIALFEVEPSQLSEAGTSQVFLEASADVVKVRLSMNGELVAELTPSDFPYLALEALSAKDNTVQDHVFAVEVEDEEGLTAEATTLLSVQLPPSGAERCLFEDTAVNGGMISALVYTEAAIVAAGWRDTGAGPRAAIWKLDPDHCQPLPGWPRMMTNWTSQEGDLGALHSLATAVAVDEDGHIAVGGNLLVNNKPQRYTALLTAEGSRLWERTGLVGEVVSSVVIAADDLVISGGWRFTSDNPPRTDAMIWRHLADNSVWKETLKAPFTADEKPDIDNLQSEWIRSILIEPGTGFVVVVGERELMDEFNKIYTRAFIARFVPLGGPVGSPSTSPGDAYKHDAVYSIAVCGDELIAGGWTRADDDPNAAPQPLFRWASGGTWSKRASETMFATELRGAACDREGKVVGAGFRSVGGSDAKVFAFADPLGSRTWYETGAAGDDAANGVACDARGFCAWPGYRTVNAKPVALVRVHHP